MGAELVPCFPNYILYGELTLRIDDEGDVTPDVCVYSGDSFDYEHDQSQVTEPPLVAVEILSPSQSVQELVAKGRRLLRAGVESVWGVQPPLRTVTVLTGERDVKTYDRDEILVDPATGIEIDLANVFRDPPNA